MSAPCQYSTDPSPNSVTNSTLGKSCTILRSCLCHKSSSASAQSIILLSNGSISEHSFTSSSWSAVQYGSSPLNTIIDGTQGLGLDSSPHAHAHSIPGRQLDSLFSVVGGRTEVDMGGQVCWNYLSLTNSHTLSTHSLLPPSPSLPPHLLTPSISLSRSLCPISVVILFVEDDTHNSTSSCFKYCFQSS